MLQHLGGSEETFLAVWKKIVQNVQSEEELAQIALNALNVARVVRPSVLAKVGSSAELQSQVGLNKLKPWSEEVSYLLLGVVG